MKARFRLATLALLALAAVATAQTPAPREAARPRPLASLDASSRAEVLDSLIAEVLRNYVEADTARMIADLVRDRAKQGAYDGLTRPSELAETVTSDLRRVNGDLHLSLRFDPEGGGSGAGRPIIVRTGAPGSAGGPGGPLVMRRGPGAPEGPGGPSTAARALLERGALERNFGLERVEILPGNVGYLEVTGFLGMSGYEEAVVSALRFLERTEAVIIDVRRNGGGSGMMSHFLFSHFLPADSIPTIRVTRRSEPEPFLMRSLVEVPGPRRPEVPLYVLTSGRTGSAGEEFTFVLQNLGRATVVGERTAGAGHMVGMYDLPHGFVAGVSITRVADPRTGREWEAVGVQPDRRVEADRALSTAHVAALEAIAAKSSDPSRKQRLEWVAEWLAAKERPSLDARRLAALTGDYEGDRTIRVVDGKLRFSRSGGITEDLAPLADGRFALGSEARVTFAKGNPAPSFTLERLDGSTITVPRSSKVKGD